MNPYSQNYYYYYGNFLNLSPVFRGWIYDPYSSTATLDCFVLLDLNPQPPAVEYVVESLILNTPFTTTYHQQPDLQYSYAQIPNLPIPYNYLENPFYRIEQEGSLAFGDITVNNSRTASGLSEETITQRLEASMAQEKTKGQEEESDVCAICLDGYDGCKKKMGRLECGHGYHAQCIKTWLLRKNVCPMCKATAFTI